MPDEVTKVKAREILGGVVGLACRLAGADENDFRVKDGGNQRTKKVKIDVYVSVQNTDVNINTTAAKTSHLIRRLFLVWQGNASLPVELKIREWDSEKDWGGDYRETWSKPYDAPQARREMATKMAESIKELKMAR